MNQRKTYICFLGGIPDQIINLSVDIATDVLTSTTRFRGFNGSWVLADTQSAAWALVRDIFVPSPRRDPSRRVPEKLMCAAFGFPVCTDNIINQVVIRDKTEYGLLQDSFDQDTCRVNVLKIVCDDGCAEDWEAIRSYCEACRDAALRLGTVLTLDLSEHPMMEQWCDEDDSPSEEEEEEEAEEEEAGV